VKQKVLNNNCRFFVHTDVAKEREVEGDVLLSDMGQGICFRPGTFDGAISISALQWLCNADKSNHKPTQRLYKFFTTLYAALVRFMDNIQIQSLLNP